MEPSALRVGSRSVFRFQNQKRETAVWREEVLWLDWTSVSQ